MRSLAVAIVLTGVWLALAAFAQSPDGDAVRGKALFVRRCGGCHALDRPMEGPRLRGVYGRRAGSDGEFAYSEALKNAKIVWDADLLDRWLTDTDVLVSGNDMSFRVPDGDERRDIIAYLRSLSDGS